ncbi:unnamed protein product [Lymnaea stagnalis]|uniref:Fe2OG dioxygenase domain-containing protein n=1 Tax=Lymnaea stagnalis TaxID=6523 RepID=A0AAV2HRU5_LYMST
MGDHSTLNSSDVNNANINTSNSGRLPGSFSLSEPRHCGCKGIRTCRLCGYSKSKQNIIQTPLYGLDCQDNNEKSRKDIFLYCDMCKKAWKPTDFAQPAFGTVITLPKTDAEQLKVHTNDQKIIENKMSNISYPITSKVKMSDHESQCMHNDSVGAIHLQGISIIENFVSEEEEAFLVTSINDTNFVNSQSGRRKQDFGPKVNFKKQKIKLSSFSGLPAYSQFLYKRMKANPCLRNFEPIELCNLEYCSERGAHIDPHLDDAWLWGERLVTLNLLSETILTFTLDTDAHLEIHVPLLRRSLIIVSSEARYKWKHSIHEEDITGKRVAMTFRELSKEFCTGGRHEEDGLKLLKIALTFQGMAVGT